MIRPWISSCRSTKCIVCDDNFNMLCTYICISAYRETHFYVESIHWTLQKLIIWVNVGGWCSGFQSWSLLLSIPVASCWFSATRRTSRPLRRPYPSCLSSLSQGEIEQVATCKIVPSARYAVGRHSLEISHQSSEAGCVAPPPGTLPPLQPLHHRPGAGTLNTVKGAQCVDTFSFQEATSPNCHETASPSSREWRNVP